MCFVYKAIDPASRFHGRHLFWGKKVQQAGLRHYAARLLLLCCLGACITTQGQPAYFIDGYHGGYWGHYPEDFTSFIVQQLNRHPDWRINLEIEPLTWDWVRSKDSLAYHAFTGMYARQQAGHRRIEFVNPAYGQSYLYNTSGESIIRQFYYGMKKIRSHFPGASFTTYSSEEPCFTSALPQILVSFGFRYASLKNPNTCWGGYTRAHGGQFVNWIGPDGTALLTVPRYGMEALSTHSTWETMASVNSKAFVRAAQQAGIRAPAGMCLQDAGWRNGPWLGRDSGVYRPTIYSTWTDYIRQHPGPAADWHVSQEDILVSLVWGAQIVQRVAQAVRCSENKLVQAEKIAALTGCYYPQPWPAAALDSAWQNLLLAQHHDCWIVPYNRKNGLTWEQYVQQWTAASNRLADSITQAVAPPAVTGSDTRHLKVWNTTLARRKELVAVELPDTAKPAGITDGKGNAVRVQREGRRLLFEADVPPAGYSCYNLSPYPAAQAAGAGVRQLPNGQYLVETDLYKLLIDPARGGTISSLIAKQMGGKEWVDTGSNNSFNEIRGFFYEEGRYHSNKEQPAAVRVVEGGPLRVTIEIKGSVAGHPLIQQLSLTQGEPRIDLKLVINWQHNTGIGAYSEKNTYDNKQPKKAFYDDRYKLLALFPLRLQQVQVYKDAPFDVVKSRLDNTFFSSWDSIKNNVMLSWVDAVDPQRQEGFTVMTDHTTSYTAGPGFPLGFTVQYSGMGLFGRDYGLDGPTEISYAWLPHRGDYRDGAVTEAAARWKEPLIAALQQGPLPAETSSALFRVEAKGWELSSMMHEGNDLVARFLNIADDGSPGVIQVNRPVKQARLVALDGRTEKIVPIQKKGGSNSITLAIPPRGFRTVRFTLNTGN